MILQCKTILSLNNKETKNNKEVKDISKLHNKEVKDISKLHNKEVKDISKLHNKETKNISNIMIEEDENVKDYASFLFIIVNKIQESLHSIIANNAYSNLIRAFEKQKRIIYGFENTDTEVMQNSTLDDIVHDMYILYSNFNMGSDIKKHQVEFINILVRILRCPEVMVQDKKFNSVHKSLIDTIQGVGDLVQYLIRDNIKMIFSIFPKTSLEIKMMLHNTGESYLNAITEVIKNDLNIKKQLLDIVDELYNNKDSTVEIAKTLINKKKYITRLVILILDSIGENNKTTLQVKEKYDYSFLIESFISLFSSLLLL